MLMLVVHALDDLLFGLILGDLSLAEKAHPFAEKIACEMDSQSYSYELDGLAIKPANPNRWGNSKCVEQP